MRQTDLLRRGRRVQYAPGCVCPRCRRRHTSWYRVAKCRWPRALWINGDPPAHEDAFALVSACPPGLSVTLWASRAEAEKAKIDLNACGCGGQCRNFHRVIVMGED
jgi:hypothetical protein